MYSPTTLPNYVIARRHSAAVAIRNALAFSKRFCRALFTKRGPRKATLFGGKEEQRSEQGLPVGADAHIRPKGNDGFFPWFRMTKEIAKPSCPEGRMVFSLTGVILIFPNRPPMRWAGWNFARYTYRQRYYIRHRIRNRHRGFDRLDR